MLKKTLALVSLFISCLSANAAVVSHYGYSLDTDTNIVTGGGLEWMQWDETIGMSINSALAAHGTEGWRLASNVEMASLFNAFDFGLVFDSDENTYQSIFTGWHVSGSQVTNHFVEIFGDTNADSGFLGVGATEPRVWSYAMFGLDIDIDSQYNLAKVGDDWNRPFNEYQNEGYAALIPDIMIATQSTPEWGIALVRTSDVPLPAAAYLFLVALTGLIGLKRRSNYPG